MKLLFTGASSYLGRRIIPEFIDRKIEIGAVIREKNPLSCLPIQFVRYDRELTKDAWREMLKDYDGVIHCATVYGRKGESEAEISWVNYQWPRELFESMSGEAFFLHIDTALPPDVSIYAREKGKLREYLNEQHGLGRHALNLRLEHFFGPGDGHFLSMVANALLIGRPELPLTLGTQRRDFIWIDDVVDAVVLLVGILAKGEVLPAEIPLGSGEARTIRSIVESIKELVPGCATELKFGAVPMRPNEPELSCADISLIKSAGWEPKWSFERALSQFIINTRVN